MNNAIVPQTNVRVVDFDAIIAATGDEDPTSYGHLDTQAETPLSRLLTRFLEDLGRPFASLMRPLSAAQLQILDDADAIEAIPPAPTVPGTIFRPVPEKQFTVEIFDMDWESVGAMCADQGLTLIHESLGIAVYSMEVRGVSVGRRSPRAVTAEIRLRKARSHTIVDVLSDLAPEGIIWNFVIRARAFLQFKEMWESHCGWYILVSPSPCMSLLPPPLPPKPSDEDGWIVMFEYFQKYRPEATNAEIAAEYGYAESHIKNKRSELGLLKRRTKKY